MAPESSGSIPKAPSLAASPVHSIPSCPSLLIPQGSCSFSAGCRGCGRQGSTDQAREREESTYLWGFCSPLVQLFKNMLPFFTAFPTQIHCQHGQLRLCSFNVLFPPTLHSPTLNAIHRCFKKIFTHIPASPPCQPKEQGLSPCQDPTRGSLLQPFWRNGSSDRGQQSYCGGFGLVLVASLMK